MRLIAFIALAVSISAAGAPIELGVKGRGNATPTIAADGSLVAVTWGGTLPSGATDVFAAVSRDGGRAFSAPVRVNNVDGDARLNGEQPPHVALVPRAGHDPSIVVVWTTKGANGTKLLQSRSEDGGRTFARGALVPGSDATGNRGWEALVGGAGGSVYAAWRHVYPGNLRDMAFTLSRDGGKTFAPPVRVSEDKWMLEGCPDDGPSMAVDARKRIHIVWPTLITEKAAGSEPTIALFYAMSIDGKQFTARERIPTEGMPHHRSEERR